MVSVFAASVQLEIPCLHLAVFSHQPLLPNATYTVAGTLGLAKAVAAPHDFAHGCGFR